MGTRNNLRLHTRYTRVPMCISLKLSPSCRRRRRRKLIRLGDKNERSCRRRRLYYIIIGIIIIVVVVAGRVPTIPAADYSCV